MSRYLLSRPLSHQATRERAIEFLARESGLPVLEVAQLYDAQFDALRGGARVLGFLDILISRKVREMLKRRGYAPAAALPSPG